MIRRPDLYADASFLFGDHSLNLLVADRLLNGATLYEDVAFQYGPIPAYGFAAWAAVFGSSVAAYNSFLLTVSVLNIGLVYALLRRYAGHQDTLLVAGLGILPSLLIPGALLGGYTVSSYLPLERTMLLAVALLWIAPDQRSTRRAATLGVALGLWQGVKFGGAFFGGAAVILIDLLALRSGESREGRWRKWINSLLVTLAAALTVQAGWVGYAFATLPTQIAIDFLWPSYVLDAYEGWMVEGDRWLSWGGWRLFIGQYLSPIIGGLAGLALLGLWLAFPGRARRMDGRYATLPLLLPLIFFLVASAGYFRQVHHFLQFGWVLVIPAVWIARRGGGAARIGLVVAFLPCFAVMGKAILLNRPDPSLRPIVTTAGEPLWMTEEVGASIDLLVDARAPGQQPDELIFVPLGVGMEHFYGVPIGTRQPWFLPGFIRPYDEADFLDSLGRSGGIVLLKGPGLDPSADDVCDALGARNPFPPSICAELESSLAPPVSSDPFFLHFPRSSETGHAALASPAG